jgi:hypothetical protein
MLLIRQHSAVYHNVRAPVSVKENTTLILNGFSYIEERFSRLVLVLSGKYPNERFKIDPQRSSLTILSHNSVPYRQNLWNPEVNSFTVPFISV